MLIKLVISALLVLKVDHILSVMYLRKSEFRVFVGDIVHIILIDDALILDGLDGEVVTGHVQEPRGRQQMIRLKRRDGKEREPVLLHFSLSFHKHVARLGLSLQIGLVERVRRELYVLRGNHLHV